MATVKFDELGPGTLTFGSSSAIKDFSARVKSVTVKPEVHDEGGTRLLNGDETFEADATFGSLTAEFFQDYVLNGLVAWTWTNANKVVPFTFIPHNSGQVKVTGKVKVKPVELGGEVKKTNTTTLTFPIVEALPVIANKG